jgi:hypothetical protein
VRVHPHPGARARNATLVARSQTGSTVQVEVPSKDSMRGAEDALQDALNAAGVLATAEALRRFDTDGEPITRGGTKLTRKVRSPKDYQAPTASPRSAATSPSPPAAARPPARSTGTPGSSSAPPPGSPR